MYSVQLLPEAESVYRWLESHDIRLYLRMRAALGYLKESPYSGKKLRADLRGRYSYRVGSYRILYEIHNQELVVLVLDIGHRREIYR